ncbi:MAG: CHAD domain-containing protein [Myxococcota bacterium]
MDAAVQEPIGLRLTLSPEAARKLTRSKGLKPHRRGRGTHEHLTSTYFDTPHHVLRKAGLALQLRQDGDRVEQTLKAPVPGPLGLHQQRRWSAPIEGDRPVLNSIEDANLARSLRRRRCESRLSSVFTTEVERTTIRLESNGAKMRLAIDEGTIRVDNNGHSKAEPICEAEIELLSGDPAGMLDVALEVCESLDVRLTHQTKAQRGYALARPTLRPRSVKAKLPTLTADLTAGESFRVICSSALEHLFRNQAPVLSGHPGGIHQTRVAMRRIRAALRAFKGLLPYEKRKAFNSEFRAFQQRLAPARDWHVFLDETLPIILAAEPDQADHIEKLRRVARQERRRATSEAVAALKSRRYARLILRFQKWLADLEREIPKKVFNQPVTPFAKSVLRKTRRELTSERRPLTRLPTEDVHTLRKNGKKARYATEFFSSLWDGPRVKPYLKLMAKLQDSLGSANDATVARQILWSLRPGRLEPEVVRLVQDWSDARIKTCITAAHPQWRRLRRAKAFWQA